MSSLGTEHPKLVYQGYNTAVYLDKAGGKMNKISCSSLSFTTNASLLSSNASYAGALNIGQTRNLGVSSPFKLDFPDITCNLTFEPTYTQLKEIIKWLKERNDYAELTIENGRDEIVFDECYLQSLNINVAKDQLLTITISLYIREEYNQSMHTIGGMKAYPNKNANSNNYPVGGIDALWQDNIALVPYYVTGLKTNGLGNYIDDRVAGWNITFSHNILKKTFCRGIKSNSVHEKAAPLPSYIMFGPLIIDATFNVFAGDKEVDHDDLLFFVQFVSNNMNDKGKSIEFYTYNKKLFDLSLFMLNSITPNVGDMHDVYSIDIGMNAYGLDI